MLRIAAEDTLHASQIISVHADKQIALRIILRPQLTRTVGASGQTMPRKLPLRARMHWVADLLRADRRRIHIIRPFKLTRADFFRKNRLRHRAAADIAVADKQDTLHVDIFIPIIFRWFLFYQIFRRSST